MTIQRFGKDSGHLMTHKASFFTENDCHSEEQRRLSEIYIRQPRRFFCKNCDLPLDDRTDFFKSGIAYTICHHCTHLNGLHQDTDEFCDAVYARNDGESYAKNYRTTDAQSYDDRVTDIYYPKAEFLVHVLSANGVDPFTLTYIDFGAGSGYFVAALDRIGIRHVIGTDVSRSQIEFGNAMIGKELSRTHRMEETQDILENIKAQVVCMIGVLEHLQHPRETLSALKKNDNVQFIYLSLPMFSFSVYLELLSPKVFHRHLHGGHTHLYTRRSLAHLQREFGFESVAEWWFGTDMVDLYRHIAVELSQEGYSARLRDLWQQEFSPLVDVLQLEFDKQFHSSQVHIVLKKRDSTL